MNKSNSLLLITYVFLFTLSTAFPIAAGLRLEDSLPAWVGVADVLLAFFIIILMISITGKTRGQINSRVKEQSFSVYQILAGLPLLLLVIFFMFGEKINWGILLPGLAWRAWVFTYSTPSIILLWDKK